MSRTTTYLVLTRTVEARLAVTVPMINRSFTASDPVEAADRARGLLAEELGVRTDSFSIEIVGLAAIPAQRAA